MDSTVRASHASWPCVGSGLAGAGGVEADRLHAPCGELALEGGGQVEADTEAGDQQQRAAGAAHRGAQPQAVDVDEPDRWRLRRRRRHP
jgi:hypothetical protein